MDCNQIERDEIIEKYLTGRLDGAELEEFEVHYFGCSKCREKLQVSRLLQEKLWEQGEKTRPQAQEPHRVLTGRRAWAISAAAMALVVAGVALWWQYTRSDRAPAGPEETSSSLIMLARIEPPLYVSPALRGAEDEAAERFRLGMIHYRDGRYGEAITDLRAAAGLHPNGANVRFFLGICLLLTEKTDEGIEELKATIGLGDSGYLEEAHFYLAKAFLGKGNVGSAKEELNWIQEKGSNLKEEAAQILAQLR
jgi:tetratricopeptide (TPR) repeat protein